MALTGILLSGLVHAQDTNEFRPYLQWRVGEFAPKWGVLDLRGISLGADFNQHWSAELALDAWQLNFEPLHSGVVFGEEQVFTLAPQARFRIPVGSDRLLLYSIVGVGGSWIQFNDRKAEGIGHRIDADGMTFSATAGLGFDYLLAPNIAFNLEGKYVWCDPIGIRIDGRRQDWDASSFLATLGLRIYFDKQPPEMLLSKAGVFKPVRFYFGTQGGFTVLTDGEWVSGAELVPKLNALGGTLNLNYTIALGADFGEHLGGELALAHTEYSLFLPGNGPVGEYSMYSAIPMLRLRFPSASGRWVPYAIAGAGVVYGEFHDVKPAGVGLGIRAKGTSPAFVAGAGVDYFIARNLSLTFESRWRYALDQKLAVPGGPTGKGDTSEIQFTVGFRAYLFEFGKRR
ncbi:MAG: outer membrane beta-barrel protein [Verrucomicrobia bacterium]|nr:outer membrane beta-barrel protein [Verrucomicrobiota bacterium]